MKRQADVLETGQRRQQVEELKDEPNLVPTRARQVVVRQSGQRLAVDANLSGRGAIETADQIEAGG